MAQRTRRRTKHRGNAAGMIEARGRTGRKPTPAETKSATAPKARPNRFDQPPTWRSAINRALIAVIFFVVLLLVIPGFDVTPAQMIPLVGFMLLIYIPMGYYTDLWMYRRRQRQKAQAANPKPKKDGA
ncbi:MAG: hypothetical protein IRZ32_10595 [Solirubrobacteraceae bacterium]|nr:hypothetical protein [Solirubrobacteraceae bacterium]